MSYLIHDTDNFTTVEVDDVITVVFLSPDGNVPYSAICDDDVRSALFNIVVVILPDNIISFPTSPVGKTLLVNASPGVRGFFIRHGYSEFNLYMQKRIYE